MMVGYTVYWPNGQEERAEGSVPIPSSEISSVPAKAHAAADRRLQAIGVLVIPILMKEYLAADEVSRKMGVPTSPHFNFERVRVIRSASEAYRNGAEYLDMFIDEDGHSRDRPRRNEKATAIYRANWLRQHPSTDPETLPWIAGPAVLFDKRVWF